MKKYMLIGAGVAAAALAALWLKKKVMEAGGVAGAVSGATAAVLNGASIAASGVVLGIGDTIGLPRTNLDECDQDIASGRIWASSFSCPARTFMGGLTGEYVPRNSGDYRLEGRNYINIQE